MKTLLQKTLMVMLAAFLSLSFASCSDDEDDDDNNGAMTGWVEIEGKKYNFKFFEAELHSDGMLFLNGYSDADYQDPDRKETYNKVILTMKFNSDGSLDREGLFNAGLVNGNHNPQFKFEIKLDYKSSDSQSATVYNNDFNKSDYIDAKISGKKITIDGVDVKLEHDSYYSGLIKGKSNVWVDFHFEGVPQEMDSDWD